MREAEQRRHHPRHHRLDRRRRIDAPRGIGLAKHRQQHDDVDLGDRRSRHGAAIVEHRGFQRLGEPRFAARAARFSPRNQQPGGDHPAPGGDARHADRHLFRAAIDVSGATSKAIEHRRSVDQIGRRQDQRRVRRPEQDAQAHQIGAPRRLGDMIGMHIEPFLHQIFRDRRGLRARRDARQVAQPGEAVQMIGETRRPIGIGERDPIDRAAFAGDRQHALHQRVAAPHVAEKRILGHRDQLQRIAPAQAKRVNRRSPGQPRETFGQALGQRQTLVAAQANQPLALLDAISSGLWRRFAAHPPLRARMLAA